MASHLIPGSVSNEPINSGPNDVPHKLDDMIKVGDVIDCRFNVGRSAETIFGHKWIFAVESPVFERMFCGDFIEGINGTVINLPDDDPNTFRMLRRILYKTCVVDVNTFSFEDILSLYKMSDKYMVQSVYKLCSKYLKKNVRDTRQLIQLFGVASEIRDGPLLSDVKKKLCYISYPLLYDELINLNGIQFMKYIILCVDHNKMLLDHMTLFRTIEYYFVDNNMLPKYLLNAVAETEPGPGPREDTAAAANDTPDNNNLLCEERKREILERLLSFVDFGTMTTDQFLAGPGTSQIITCHQKYFILSQLSKVPCRNCYLTLKTTIKLFQNK